MAENIMRKGYGQVEPNHLSGIVEGRIYAQLPAAKVTPTPTGEGASAVTTTKTTPITQLEQGQFAKYDYAAGVVNFDGEGEFMLVYNEEKLYDERKQNHKDFVYKAKDFTDGMGYPRLIATEVGDIITTNTITIICRFISINTTHFILNTCIVIIILLINHNNIPIRFNLHRRIHILHIPYIITTTTTVPLFLRQHLLYLLITTYLYRTHHFHITIIITTITIPTTIIPITYLSIYITYLPPYNSMS